MEKAVLATLNNEHNFIIALKDIQLYIDGYKCNQKKNTKTDNTHTQTHTPIYIYI